MKTYSQLSKDRIDLRKAIPLKQPLALLFEPANLCNMKCPFCYYSDPEFTPGGLMKWAEFKQIFYDLHDWCAETTYKFKVIRFIGFGEPLINKYTPNMVKEVRPITQRTEITTNGTLLTPWLSELLIDAELDYLRVSIYNQDVTENLKVLKRLRGDKEYPFIYVKAFDEEKLEPYKDIADEVALEGRHFWLNDQLGAGVSPPSVCPQPFKMLSIRYNGDVIVCDPDWKNNTKVGNALETSIKDIWEGEKLKKFQFMQLLHRRYENASCQTCSFVYNDSYVKDRL